MIIRRLLLWVFIFLCTTRFCQADELIIEPDMGRAPLLSAISQAHSSIDVVIYGLTDAHFIEALIQAKNNHKKVRVLLEPNPYKSEDENTSAIYRFQAAKVNLQWPNIKFHLTHQKTILLDQRTALVLTFNLTYSAFKNERNFALLITDPITVAEIEKIFSADWQHSDITTHAADIILSPDNSREKIMQLIRNAQKEIDIYAQDLSDYQIIGALAKAARAGIKVKILLSPPSLNNPHEKRYHYLTKAGVRVHFSDQYIIHAKVLIIDEKFAVIGSINLTQPSMDDNRELSVITHETKVVRALLATFKQDY